LQIYARIHRLEKALLDGLAHAGVGDLADAMHGMGVADADIQQVYSPMIRLFGPAITVDVTPGDGMLLRAAVALAAPGDVIVVNSHGVTARAVLGGAVAMHMVHRGVAGLVVDGAVRDAAEMRALGFPVMARAVTPRSGTSPSGWGEVNVPVACGGIVVNPGDIMVGDEEGLVVVPRLWAASVADLVGKTGHAAYEPEAISKRLVELTSDSSIPGLDSLRKALADRGGTVIDGHYGDSGPQISL
jgi:regulator of RNase E activity RraA